MDQLSKGKIGFKNVESEELRVQGFKKEFKIKLNQLVNNQLNLNGNSKYNSNRDIH